MIFFDNIYKLEKHFKYISNQINNENIFIVGGPIRDLLLGIETKLDDIDLTCGGTPEEIYKNINKEDISIFKTDKFGTITFIPKDNKKTKYELTPLRSEGKYEDFRHPGEINWTSDIVLDSKRRDFTINSLYYTQLKIKNSEFKIKYDNQLKDFERLIKILENDGYIFLVDKNILILQNNELISKLFPQSILDKKELIDLINNAIGYYFENKEINKEYITILIDANNGIQDIISKRIKAVGNPDDRFQEDALRVIRGIRFVNILNQKLEKIKSQDIRDNAPLFFDFESNTRRSLKKNYYLVKYVAKERIKEEMMKVFKADNPFGFVSLLDDLYLLKTIFPSVFQTKHIDQPVRYHPFDVYAHTMLCFHNIQKINKNYLVKFAMLYHDVGKTDQYYYVSIGLMPEERRAMHGLKVHHPKYGIDLATDDFRALGFSKKEIDEICFYIENHMVPGEILTANHENMPNKVRKLLSQYGYNMVDNLFDIAIADRLGQYNPLQSPNIDGLKYLKKLLKEIHKQEGQFGIKEMAVDGNDVIKFFKIEKSPKIGEILNTTLEWILEDINNRNNIKEIQNYWKQKFGK